MPKCPHCGSRNVRGGIGIFEITPILIGLLLSFTWIISVACMGPKDMC